MSKSPEEIKAEIEKLKQMKPSVLPESAFGDKHHDAIDAQVRVLEEDMEIGDIIEEFERDADNVLQAARDARDWADGESDFESLSGEWQSLVR